MQDLTTCSYGRDQTCAMLLAIASGNTFLDPMEQSPVGAMNRVSPELAAVARQAFYDFGERPSWAERVTYGTSEFTLSSLVKSMLIDIAGEGSGTATFSGRREGLALYFARLVRPFWKVPITKTGCVRLSFEILLCLFKTTGAATCRISMFPMMCW